MKIESISLNFLTHKLIHSTSAGEKPIEVDKKNLYPSALAYIEQYCTANGFEIINVTGEGNLYVYHLIKR